MTYQEELDFYLETGCVTEYTIRENEKFLKEMCKDDPEMAELLAGYCVCANKK